MPINKTTQMTANGPAKMPGWFSWRHQTSEACDNARQAYFDTHATARARFARAERARKGRAA